MPPEFPPKTLDSFRCAGHTSSLQTRQE